MAVSETALVSRDELVRALGLAEPSSDLGAELDMLIDAATQAIEGYCSTAFVVREREERHRRPSPGRDTLYLSRYPIAELDSIEDPAGNVVAATEIVLAEEQGTIRRPGGWPVPQNVDGNEDRWIVSYTAGRYEDTAAVEARVKRAAIGLVAHWRNNPTPGISSKTMGNVSIVYQSPIVGAFTPDGLPTAVAALLGPFVSRDV